MLLKARPTWWAEPTLQESAGLNSGTFARNEEQRPTCRETKTQTGKHQLHGHDCAQHEIRYPADPEFGHRVMTAIFIVFVEAARQPHQGQQQGNERPAVHDIKTCT